MIEIPGALAVIAAALFSGLLLLYVQRRNAFRSASLSFRSAFIEELSLLESATNKGVCARDVLIKSYEKHRNAVAEFRLHLGALKRRGFDKAWKEHHLSKKYDDVRSNDWGIPGKDHVYLQYLWPNAGSEEDATKLAILNIRSLLKYANP